MPPEQCPIVPEVGELTSSIKVLCEKTDTLITLNRDIIKWLLIVVCIIALGRSAFDVGKDLLTHAVTSVSAETKTK